MSAAQVDIRNKIASLGANAMVITAQYTDPPPYPHGNISAEAYKCEFASDRKQPEAAIVGLILTDLTPAQRTELERNSGANVSAVVDDSPAWKANVIPGDVVVEINQEQVKNGLHATKLLNQADVGRRSITIVLIRKGAQRTITVSK
jgi:S1-C subfamily serine protease